MHSAGGAQTVLSNSETLWRGCQGFYAYGIERLARRYKGVLLDGYLPIRTSTQGLNLMTQPTVLTVPDRPRERRQLSEFFAFDGDYVDRLTGSDVETERHFVGYFSPLLLMKLKQRLRSQDQLEDLRQEVFLRVFRSLRQGAGLRRPECLGAYVYSVCNHVVLEYLRDTRKPERSEERVEEQRDPGAGIERELVNEELRRQVRNLLNGMTPKDRFLICAIFLDERDKDEVCREQGVRRDYMRVLLHRAKQRFRQLLAETQAAATPVAHRSNVRGAYQHRHATRC
jgi:RNA polymerase sigma-70 factor (ECF subfamily)